MKKAALSWVMSMVVVLVSILVVYAVAANFFRVADR